MSNEITTLSEALDMMPDKAQPLEPETVLSIGEQGHHLVSFGPNRLAGVSIARLIEHIRYLEGELTLAGRQPAKPNPLDGYFCLFRAGQDPAEAIPVAVFERWQFAYELVQKLAGRVEFREADDSANVFTVREWRVLRGVE